MDKQVVSLVFGTVWKNTRILNIITNILALVSFGINFLKFSVQFFYMIISMLIIYYLCFFLSFALHELGHVMVLKKEEVPFEIVSNFYKISVIPLKPLEKHIGLLTALAGPGLSALVGGGLYLFNLFLGSDLLKLASFIYILHLLFLLPCFGDGRAILKFIISKK